MNQTSLTSLGTPHQRVEKGLNALKAGKGILVADDDHRENEVDLIFPAQSVTHSQMALMIRECSGIVCLCLTPEKARALNLSMMVKNNTSAYGTAFTTSIEAARDVTTGVSAKDRVTTVRAAADINATAADLHQPGHIFPIQARPGGVLERAGHTEATVEMMKLAGLEPSGVLCELTNPDGTMASLSQAVDFGKKHHFPVLTVEDLIAYKKSDRLQMRPPAAVS